MPSFANSPARCRVNATTPALAAAYAADDLAACRAAAEDIVTIAPECRAIMPGRNAEIVRNVEVRSLSRTERQCSPVSRSVGTGMPLPPANAARTSTGPSCASTTPRIAAIAASFVQSAATPIARPPSVVIDSTVASIAAWSRPTTATSAPFTASARLVAAPMPRDPPVTTATLPARSSYRPMITVYIV